jgi:hypothetical protein
MSATATVHDFTPGAFRKKFARTQAQTDTAPTTDAATIFSDMADGVLALDYGLTFAGFEYEERQLVHSIVGLLGEGETELAMFDERLADHLKCSTRTVRRWRAAYVEKSQAVNFGFLVITEGEYISAEKRYQPTRYRFTADAKDYVEQTVDEARGSGSYERDRRGAIEKAAGAHYEEVPQAPPRLRNAKPKRSSNVQIERDFINAKNNLTKGQRTLGDLQEHRRTAFLAGAEGEKLRALLLQMQHEIAGLLQDFPQTTDEVELNEVPDILSGTPPPVSGTPHEAKDESAGVETPATSVRPSSSYTRTQDLEAAAVFDRFDERLRAPRPPAPPKVSTVELEIVAEPEPIVDDVPIDEPEYFADAPPIENASACTFDEPEELASACHFDADETPAELTIELDPEDEREGIAMRAIEYGYEFDAEGNIERIPPGVPDDFHAALWRTQHEAQHERLNE